MSSNLHERARAVVWAAAGTQLRELREVRGWEQAELAARAVVPLGVVAQYELGLARHPTLENWWRLTAALGVDLPAFVRNAEVRTGATLLGDVLDPREPLSAAPPAGGGAMPPDDLHDPTMLRWRPVAGAAGAASR